MLKSIVLPNANPATPNCIQSRRGSAGSARPSRSDSLNFGSYPRDASSPTISLNLTDPLSNATSTSFRGKLTCDLPTLASCETGSPAATRTRCNAWLAQESDPGQALVRKIHQTLPNRGGINEIKLAARAGTAAARMPPPLRLVKSVEPILGKQLKDSQAAMATKVLAVF